MSNALRHVYQIGALIQPAPPGGLLLRALDAAGLRLPLVCSFTTSPPRNLPLQRRPDSIALPVHPPCDAQCIPHRSGHSVAEERTARRMLGLNKSFAKYSGKIKDARAKAKAK